MLIICVVCQRVVGCHTLVGVLDSNQPGLITRRCESCDENCVMRNFKQIPNSKDSHGLCRPCLKNLEKKLP